MSLLLSSSDIRFDFSYIDQGGNPAHSLVEYSPNSWNIVQKLLQSNSNGALTSDYVKLLDSTGATPSSITDQTFLNYVFYNKGILSEFTETSEVQLSVPTNVAGSEGSKVGFISMQLASSDYLYTNNPTVSYTPRIRFFLFGVRLVPTSTVSPVSYNIYPFINRYVLYYDYVSSTVKCKLENLPTNSVYMVSNTNYDTTFIGNSYITLTQTSGNLLEYLQFTLQRQNFGSADGSYRDRYIFTVTNTQTSNPDNKRVLRYDFPSPTYIQGNDVNRRNNLDVNGIDRVGVFEALRDNGSGSMLGVGSIFNQFSIDLNLESKTDVLVVSDSVGVGFGETGTNSGKSYISELQRTLTYNNYVNGSRINISSLDVLDYCKDCINIIKPKETILNIGSDSVGRKHITQSNIFGYINNTRLYTDFSVGEFTKNNTTDLFTQTSIKIADDPFSKFNELYSYLVTVTDGIVVVLGMPPIPISSGVEFFYHVITTGGTKFVLDDLSNYSNLINSNSLIYDYFIDLRSQFGSANTWSTTTEYKANLDSYTIFFNYTGHNLVRQLLSDFLSNATTSITSTQVTKYCDIRLVINKVVNNQKQYSIDDSQTYTLLYDAKIDINLPNTSSITGTVPTFDGYSQIQFGNIQDFNYIIIIPYISGVSMILLDSNNSPIKIPLDANKPTMLFVSFKELWLSNISLKDAPISLTVGKVV